MPDDLVRALTTAATRVIELARVRVAGNRMPVNVVFTENLGMTDELDQAFQVYARAFEALFFQPDGEINARYLSSISNRSDRGVASMGMRTSWQAGVPVHTVSLYVCGAIFTYRRNGDKVGVTLPCKTERVTHEVMPKGQLPG
jgi:hypothetical protein